MSVDELVYLITCIYQSVLTCIELVKDIALVGHKYRHLGCFMLISISCVVCMLRYIGMDEDRSTMQCHRTATTPHCHDAVCSRGYMAALWFYNRPSNMCAIRTRTSTNRHICAYMQHIYGPMHARPS